MKRVTIWVDCKDGKVGDIRREIETFLKSRELVYMIVEVCQLVSADKCSK